MCGCGRRNKICISHTFLAEADVVGPQTLTVTGPKLDIPTQRLQCPRSKTMLHNNYITSMLWDANLLTRDTVEGEGEEKPVSTHLSSKITLRCAQYFLKAHLILSSPKTRPQC